MTDEPTQPAPPDPPSTGNSTPKPGLLKRWIAGLAGTPAKTAPDAWDKAGEWLAAHGPLPVLGVITIAMLVIHGGVFRGETAGDDLTFHFAESARLADCLRVGDFDFWNPSANAGYASAYYYQVLPQLASALPAALFGHHLFWFQLSVVLPLVLAPACAYRGMRLLGATPWQAVLAAFAVGFMNGESRWGAGNAGTFQVGLYTQTWALCAFPLALGHGARWITEAKSLAPAIAWGAFVFLCHPFAGVGLGISILAGWIAQLVLLAFDELGVALAGVLRGKRPWLDRLVARWDTPPARPIVPELVRGVVLALALAVTWLPLLLPIFALDTEGFGGFPHRVSDEIGPGFGGLWTWYHRGAILDFLPSGLGFRLAILTWLVPVIVVLARAKFLRWLWAPALLFALLLGFGPHMGKLGDDIFPPVRALGAMQIVLALGVGAGAMIVGQWLWQLAARSTQYAYGIRTVLAAIAAALAVLVVVPGSRALVARVHVLEDYPTSHPTELFTVDEILARQPPGRKQVGPGAENHWWNLLSYAFDRVPALLQMGGGGLQASPNYDFLWTNRDFVKNAWIYDAPYLVFETAKGKTMPLGDTIARTETFEIRRLPTNGLVSPVQVIGTLPPGYHPGQLGHLAALEWIKGDRPIHDQVLAYVGSGGFGPPPDAKTLRAWHQDSPGNDADIVAEVEAKQSSTFVIRESWHPRWRAFLDGESVPVRRVTPDFPAVDVPAGKHTIELRFDRPWWMQAAWLGWPGMTLLAWLITRRRRSPD